MNLPISEILTIISALESHRILLRSLITSRPAPIENTVDREEIVTDLRLTNILSHSLESKELNLNKKDTLYLKSIIGTEKAYVNALAAESDNTDTREYSLAHQTLTTAEQTLDHLITKMGVLDDQQ